MANLAKAITLLYPPVQRLTFSEQPTYSIDQVGLILLLLNKLHPTQQGLVYKFSSNELTAFTGLAYSFTSLQPITTELGSLTFTIQSGRSYEQYRLFQSVSYLLKEEEICIKFTRDILPCLYEWKERLTDAGFLPCTGAVITK